MAFMMPPYAAAATRAATTAATMPRPMLPLRAGAGAAGASVKESGAGGWKFWLMVIPPRDAWAHVSGGTYVRDK